jgi:MFS family permease
LRLRDAASVMGAASFRRLLAAGTLLSVATVSDAFVYLALQRQMTFDERLVPLLFVGTAFAFMALAIPLGRLADRYGRVTVFLTGYAALLGVYALLLTPSAGMAGLLAALGLLGTYYAATDGVLAAVTSAFVPERLLASGLAVVVTGTSLGRLVASIAFGALWVTVGLQVALAIFGGALCIAAAVAVFALRGLNASLDRA